MASKPLSFYSADEVARARSYPLNPASAACPSLSESCSSCVAYVGSECLSDFASKARINRVAVRMVQKINVRTLLLFLLVAVPLFEIINVALYNLTH